MRFGIQQDAFLQALGDFPREKLHNVTITYFFQGPGKVTRSQQGRATFLQPAQHCWADTS